MRERRTLALAAAALLAAPVAMLAGPAAASLLLDPLHGYCAAAGTEPAQCIDNGVNSPTVNADPVNFGFTVSPGPATGVDFRIVVLTPNNETAPASFAITGTNTGTASRFGGTTSWGSGTLSDFLGLAPPASPNNPIGAFLPSTDKLDPGAASFDVFQLDVTGSTTLNDDAMPHVSPLDNISPGLPLGSYIVAFFNEGTALTPEWIATANSGAVFVSNTLAPLVPVPEPGSLALLGTALAGFGWLGWRRRQRARQPAPRVA